MEDFLSISALKQLMEEQGLKPNKGFGQNFLIDQNILQKIIETADIKPTDTILEVGPGLGVLTRALAASARKVIAVEKDRNMVQLLQTTLKEVKNVQIVQGDILETDIQDLAPKTYKVVANIPYYITSPLIRKFLEVNPPAGGPPTDMVLMVQKEVAQRICSKVPDMNLLAVSVQYYATPKIAHIVSKHSFWPAPKIDSAILKITPHEEMPKDADAFFNVVKAGFSQPRKQLANNFSKSLDMKREDAETWLKKNNIEPNQRAETLTIQDWKNLTVTKSL
jgi:16S rRNA (adenine1518-N6/adenine1519-N6)-dimethyltransferase